MAGFSKLQFGAVLVLCLFMLPYSIDGSKPIFNEKNYTVSVAPRKLLSRSLEAMENPNRIWGEKCATGNILTAVLKTLSRRGANDMYFTDPGVLVHPWKFDSYAINQRPMGPLPSGIPAFIVEILNRCATGCHISNIHFSCGSFSSNQLINPKVFRRLGNGDCLVNDGKPLRNGATLSFTYSNSFSYPLSVSSIACSGRDKTP